MTILPSREPCGLTKWVLDATVPSGKLFTCARPGRSLGRKRTSIDDATVLAWLKGLPKEETVSVIVSLLGRKPEPDGRSEFSYYSFKGAREDRPSSPTFQEWLDRATTPGKYMVIEHPTIDTKPISPEVLTAIVACVVANLDANRTVVVVDSGGVSRTGAVIRLLSVTLNCRLVASPMTASCTSR